MKFAGSGEVHSPSGCLVKYIICHLFIFVKFKTAPLYQSRTVTLPNDTKALHKHIVSFGAAKRKLNICSLLAVIFIPKIRKDGAYGTKKKTSEASKRLWQYQISRQRTLQTIRSLPTCRKIHHERSCYS